MKTYDLSSSQLSALRVRTAELCGWTRIDAKPECVGRVSGYKTWLTARRDLGGTPPRDKGKAEDDQTYEAIPNYPADLNAMAEAERAFGKLDKGGWGLIDRYMETLFRVVQDPHICPTTHAWEYISATALQRCIAFVLTRDGRLPWEEIA